LPAVDVRPVKKQIGQAAPADLVPITAGLRVLFGL